ncbi:MAG: helix-turn-helix domain-containing protein, partial [Planctomycetota bacterium]|nr:helix-turn-helix domain-containing protein [Planctomycetota bacterium]
MAKAGQGRLRRRRRTRGVLAEVAAAYGVTLPDEAAVPAFSPNEIAEIMSVTGEAVKQWIYHRQLPAARLTNGYWKVRKTDLERFLQARVQGTKRKILVAGADAKGLQPLCEAANTKKYEAVATSLLTDALLKIQDLQPALLIVDVSDWSEGWGLVEKLRTVKAARSLPVLLIAGAMRAADADKALQLEV